MSTTAGTEFSGREPLEFSLRLSPSNRAIWLARRLEAYRDATVQYSASIIRNRVGKQTVAEAEAQAVLETDGFTKLIPLEAPLYGDVLRIESFTPTMKVLWEETNA